VCLISNKLAILPYGERSPQCTPVPLTCSLCHCVSSLRSSCSVLYGDAWRSVRRALKEPSGMLEGADDVRGGDAGTLKLFSAGSNVSAAC
jgi:hypothetical protein